MLRPHPGPCRERPDGAICTPMTGPWAWVTLVFVSSLAVLCVTCTIPHRPVIARDD